MEVSHAVLNVLEENFQLYCCSLHLALEKKLLLKVIQYQGIFVTINL